MRYDYNFYLKNESTDGNINITEHGFCIDIVNNKVDFDSFCPYGDYELKMAHIRNKKQLKSYLENHINDVREFKKNSFENFSRFLDLIDMLS